MKVTVIGTGKMGRGFAAELAPLHEVITGSRESVRAVKVATSIGVTGMSDYRDAAAGARVVILTVPWEAMDDTLAVLGDQGRKVIIDVSFPYNKGEREISSRTVRRVRRSRSVYRRHGCTRAGATSTRST